MTDQNQVVTIPQIENRIFSIRGAQVMIDRDLAALYQVEVKRLNEQVKRNIIRFPDHFRFQLNDFEKNELVANCDRFQSLKHSSVNPYAFTEQGVAMLSAVLKSQTAVKVSIQIMQAFVEMRKFMASNALLFHRLDRIENKLLETDQKFEQVFKALESRETAPKQGVFFDGQVFDAWNFISDLVKKAKKSIVLIDNYLDDSVLALLSKKNNEVSVILLTKKITSQFILDVEKFNKQYPKIQLIEFDKSHDRFLIIDEAEVYHLGASLKDLGKKWFAFTRLERGSVSILQQINDLLTN